MKFLSVRTLVICILLPPILFLLGIQGVARWAGSVCTDEIHNRYVGDTTALLAGEIGLKQLVRNNIDGYLRRQVCTRAGLEVDVTVVTRSGALLYPALFENDPPAPDARGREEIARENFRLLNEPHELRVHADIAPVSPLSGLILLLSLLPGAGGVAWAYRRGLRRAREEEARNAEEMAQLSTARARAMDDLEALRREKEQLAGRLTRVHADLENTRERSERTEEEMVAELVAVEEQLERRQEEIDLLRQELKQMEQTADGVEKRKQKEADGLQKRFRTIYKRVAMHERALRGFVELTDEMRIKAEEVIHQLNEEPDKVVIKRKVFGSKTSATSFEVIFAYKGRLYFRKTAANAVEVLTIGTKNTQDRDLAFLEKL
jgi:hypothetical protein